jgi:hypothetical protein
MRQTLLAAEEIPWHEIPGVKLVGAVLGILLLGAAIRSMFGKGGR